MAGRIQHALELSQRCRYAVFWKEIEHVTVQKGVEQAPGERQRTGIGPAKQRLAATLSGAFARALQHRDRKVDAHAVSSGSTCRELCVRGTGSYCYLQQIPPPALLHQRQRSPVRPRLRQSGPHAVYGCGDVVETAAHV